MVKKKTTAVDNGGDSDNNNKASTGTEIGTAIKDVFEVLVPGGDVATKLIDLIFKGKKKDGNENIKISEDELTKKLNSFQLDLLKKVHKNLKKVTRLNNEITYVESLRKQTSSIVSGYMSILTMLQEGYDANQINIDADLAGAQAKLKKISEILLTDIVNQDIGQHVFNEIETMIKQAGISYRRIDLASKDVKKNIKNILEEMKDVQENVIDSPSTFAFKMNYDFITLLKDVEDEVSTELTQANTKNSATGKK